VAAAARWALGGSRQSTGRRRFKKAMKAVLVVTALAMVALVATPAMAVNTVNDPWPDGGVGAETNLYDIYNGVFGSDFGSTNGATTDGDGGAFDSPGDYTGGLDDLFVDESGIFFTNALVAVQVVFAANNQRFGYYADNGGGALSGDPSSLSGGGTDGDFTHMLDVAEGDSFPIVPANQPVAPFGFYLNSPAGGATTFFSEADRNTDAFDHDHMVIYRGLNGDGSESDVVFLVAFEDTGLGHGDRDFNDLVLVLVFDEPPSFDPPIPEPATAGLLLMGLAGVAIRRRFKA
jgi:hypothetical protein